jgi:hypothetical protein
VAIMRTTLRGSCIPPIPTRLASIVPYTDPDRVDTFVQISIHIHLVLAAACKPEPS